MLTVQGDNLVVRASGQLTTPIIEYWLKSDPQNIFQIRLHSLYEASLVSAVPLANLTNSTSGNNNNNKISDDDFLLQSSFIGFNQSVGVNNTGNVNNLPSNATLNGTSTTQPVGNQQQQQQQQFITYKRLAGSQIALGLLSWDISKAVEVDAQGTTTTSPVTTVVQQTTVASGTSRQPLVTLGPIGANQGENITYTVQKEAIFNISGFVKSGRDSRFKLLQLRVRVPKTGTRAKLELVITDFSWKGNSNYLVVNFRLRNNNTIMSDVDPSLPLQVFYDEGWFSAEGVAVALPQTTGNNNNNNNNNNNANTLNPILLNFNSTGISNVSFAAGQDYDNEVFTIMYSHFQYGLLHDPAFGINSTTSTGGSGGKRQLLSAEKVDSAGLLAYGNRLNSANTAGLAAVLVVATVMLLLA